MKPRFNTDTGKYIVNAEELHSLLVNRSFTMSDIGTGQSFPILEIELDPTDLTDAELADARIIVSRLSSALQRIDALNRRYHNHLKRFCEGDQQ